MVYFPSWRKSCISHQRPSDSVIKHCTYLGSAISDIGSMRTNNEDNYLLGQFINFSSSDHSEIVVSPFEDCGNWQLAGVFDGIGGGEAGELASRNTAEIFLSVWQTISNAQTKTDIDHFIRSAFLASNNKIVTLREACRIGGTTGTVLCTNGFELKIYHLGDSRAYLVHGDVFLQLTKDQTLAQMKLDAGIYEENDPRVEMDKHKLLEYIGKDSTMKKLKPWESPWTSIKPGDCILLCSDGLYDMCSDQEIADVLRRPCSIGDKTRQLVQCAISHGGQDNITCVVMDFIES